MTSLTVPDEEIDKAVALCKGHTISWLNTVTLETYTRSRLGKYSQNVVARHLGNYLKFFNGSAPIEAKDGRDQYMKLVSSTEFMAAAQAIRSALDSQFGSAPAVQASSTPVIRIRIPDEEHLFSVEPFYGQSDETGADLVVDMTFHEASYEITDSLASHPSPSDDILLAINRCWLHVDFPEGLIDGDDQEWTNLKGHIHTLIRGGPKRAAHWRLDAKQSGAPIRGRFVDNVLCRLLGPDRSQVRVRLVTRVSGLKVHSKIDNELVGNDRLRVFHRLVVNAFEQGRPQFDQNESLTIFDAPIQTLDGN